MKLLLICPKTNLDISAEKMFLEKTFDTTTMCENANAENVLKEISSNKYQVVHFATHGLPHLLELNDRRLLSMELKAAISVASNIKLLFLNACDSINISSELQNIDTISWRTEVENHIAVNYAIWFYTIYQFTNDIELSKEAANQQLRFNYKEIEEPIVLKRINHKADLHNQNNSVTINISGKVEHLVGQEVQQ